MAEAEAEYEAFLNRANEHASRSGGVSTQSSSPPKGTKQSDAKVPAALSSVDATYASESDEPFKGVSFMLREGEKDVNARRLKQLLNHKGEVEELDLEQWDPTGRYQHLVEAVEGVVDNGIKVFKVVLGGARVEYFVVGIIDEVLTGVKALSVES